MREAQQQDEVFGKQDKDQIKHNRDDSAAKNIVQMKNISMDAFTQIKV